MPDRRTWVEHVMGLPVSVCLRGEPIAAASANPAAAARAEPAVAAFYAELREVDALFSTYREDSQVSAMNRGVLKRAEYHPWLCTVIELCHEARERTDGYFDAWLPKPDGRTWFDPSGLVKGWAVERAARHVQELPGIDYCLNAGGDILVGGSWRIGIEDPTDPKRLLATLVLVDGAVATSGSAHRGAHVLVPATGAPARGAAAVTVTGPTLIWADVLATAAVARGSRVIEWFATLDDFPGYEAMSVAERGAVTTSPGLVATFAG
jgi:thiamine biosynthesis lipoprotein